MTERIKVSVIVPVYNMEKYLKQSLDSIINQTLSDIEIICINDGSTDKSAEILKQYEINHQIIVIDQNNQGAGPARNKGIDVARGKYVAFMDPDDYYANDEALETLYTYAEKENVLICGGNLKDTEGFSRENEFHNNMLMRFSGFNMTGSYTRYIFALDFLKKHDIFFPNYRRYQDPPFMAKAMIIARKFYAVNIDVYVYRTNYKKLDFNYSVALNVMNGIIDILELTYKYSFDTSFPQNELEKYIDYILKHCCEENEEVIDKSKDLNASIEKVLGQEYLISYKEVELYKKECMEICQLISDSDSFIVYGAGIIGRSVIKNLMDINANIKGIAVTSLDNNLTYVDGYQVKKIDEYDAQDEKTCIVISVGKRYRDQVIEAVQKKGFNNYFIWNEGKFEYIKKNLMLFI